MIPVTADARTRLLSQTAPEGSERRFRKESTDFIAGTKSKIVTIPRREGHLVSTTSTLMSFVRAEVSAGCLSLPIAFKLAGLWVGLIVSPLFGIVNAIYGNILVACSQRMCEKTGSSALDYGHLAKKAFDYGPERLRRFSKVALYVTNFFVVAYTLGVASVQALFQADTLNKFLIFAKVPWVPGTALMLVFCAPIFIAIVQIHRLDVLGYVALVGNILLIGGLVILMQYVVRPPSEINHLDSHGDFLGFILFTGSMMYSYEGQAMLLPLENRMKHPEDMRGWTGVVTVGTVILGIFFTGVGFFGYVKFGADTAQTLTLNMPNTWLYQIVNLLLVGAVFAGWPLQVYVVTEMLWAPVRRKYLQSCIRYEKLLVVLYRALVVMIILGLCWSIPQIGYLVSLVGVSAGSILAVVLPPTLQLMVFWDDWSTRQRTFYAFLNTFVITLGLVIFFVGSYGQILNIYNLS